MKKYKGIDSVLQWQFSAAFCLYMLSILFFAKNGEFQFRWAQLTFSSFISFIVVTSLCWQWRLFGDPRRIANFILHMAFFLSCVFFINRMFIKESIPVNDFFSLQYSPSVSDFIANLLEVSSKMFVSWIPTVIFDALRSPGVLILFLMVALSLSFRRRVAIALLIFSVFISIVFCIGNAPSESKWIGFFAGVAAMGAALYLQLDDSDSRKFWTTVLERLKDDPALRVEMELKTRLLKRIYERQRPLTQIECLGIVSRALGMEIASPQAQDITRQIAEKLVHQDHLAKYVGKETGKALGLNTEEFIQWEPDAFATIAIIPKTVIFVIFAFLWIISPIDLIMDATPIFGAMDDVMVGTLAFSSILQSITGMRLIKGRQNKNLFPDDPPVIL